MSAVADRYISKSGRTADYDRSTFTEDLITAASFLVWAEDDGSYFSGYSAEQAFRAMCRMLDLDPVGLRKVVLDPTPATQREV